MLSILLQNKHESSFVRGTRPTGKTTWRRVNPDMTHFKSHTATFQPVQRVFDMRSHRSLFSPRICEYLRELNHASETTENNIESS